MPKSSDAGYIEKPENSRVRLRRSPRELVINIPPQGFHPRLILLILICIAPIFLGFFLIIRNVLYDNGFVNAPGLFSLSLGLGMTSFLIFSLALRTALYMDNQWFCVEYFLFFKRQQLSSGRLGGKISDIEAVKIDSAGFKFRHESDRGILIKEGKNTYSIGSHLSRSEKLWLVETIRKFLISLDSKDNTFLTQQSLPEQHQGSLEKVDKEEIYLSSRNSKKRQNAPLRKPSWSEVSLTKEINELWLTIPSMPQSQLFFWSVVFALSASFLLTAVSAIVIPPLFQFAFAEDNYRFALLLGIILMSPVFFVVSLSACTWISLHAKTIIHIDSEKFFIRNKYLWGGIIIEGYSKKISGIELRKELRDADDENNFEPTQKLFLLEQDKAYEFGGYLDKCEQLWLLQEMNVFLNELPKYE